MTPGDVIRREREGRGWSQAVLAQKLSAVLGTSIVQSEVSRWESGQYRPDLAEASAMADMFGVTLDELACRIGAGVDLSGVWWAAWGSAVPHELIVTQVGALLTLNGSGSPTPWEGEVRLSGATMVGWTVNPASPGVRSALGLTLSEDATVMVGGWHGHPSGALLERGWGVVARDRDQCETVMARLANAGDTVADWSELL